MGQIDMLENYWRIGMLGKLFLYGCITKYTTLSKLFVFRIVTLSYNCSLRISIIYLETYSYLRIIVILLVSCNCVQRDEYMYLLIPPNDQDMTQGQNLSKV